MHSSLQVTLHSRFTILDLSFFEADLLFFTMDFVSSLFLSNILRFFKARARLLNTLNFVSSGAFLRGCSVKFSTSALFDNQSYQIYGIKHKSIVSNPPWISVSKVLLFIRYFLIAQVSLKSWS